jgi:hypothetical protein
LSGLGIVANLATPLRIASVLRESIVEKTIARCGVQRLSDRFIRE